MSVSDCNAYDTIVSCLAATRLFGTVLLDDVDRSLGEPHANPLAIVSPGSWTESMTDDPSRAVRLVHYRVTIRVRANHPRARLLEADRLTREVIARLNGANVGEGCVTRLSSIHRGESRLSSGSGEAICELKGSFSVLVPSSFASSITTE